MPGYILAVVRSGKPLQERAVDLADDHAAWEQATIACGEMLKDIDGSLRKGGDLRLQVSNAGRTPLFTIRVSSIVHTSEPFP